MVVITCTIPTCDFKTNDVSKALAIALLANHGLAYQWTLPNTPGPSLPPVTCGPKLERPKVNIGVSTEGWNVFTRRWEVFRTGSGINDESAPSQLFQCAANELGDSLLKANPHAASNTLQDLLCCHALSCSNTSCHWCPTHRAVIARNNRSLAPLWPICESVYAEEGVLLYQDCVIVPSSLLSRVLQNLHAAYQGTSMMEKSARAIVYSPGMSTDIHNIRDRCADCNSNASRQAATPPLPTTPPSTPFEAMFTNFFTYGGHHYLVIGDCLSGWVEVFGSPAGTTLAGAAGLIRHLRSNVWCTGRTFQ